MTVEIPASLRPYDGRFGSGPAKVRDAQLADLVDRKKHIIGTSHRHSAVKGLVGKIQSQLRDLFDAPDEYEIVMGNGGSTVFWDVAAFSLISERAQCLDFGVFGGRFARVAGAPWLSLPSVRKAPWGELTTALPEDGIDVYAWPQNETSTGVLSPVERVSSAEDDLILIDGTSSAGSAPFEVTSTDAYYFAPQKNFGSDGALWVALMSPAAIERAERIHASGRYIPESLNLKIAADNSRKQQTLNTPALTTLLLFDSQVEWMLDNGGMGWAANRVRSSSGAIYDWAEQHDLARPFVENPEHRSPTNVTIEFASHIDAEALARLLRYNGIVDVEPYRGVGANQLRVGTYVSVDPEDSIRLTESIDFLLPHVMTQ